MKKREIKYLEQLVKDIKSNPDSYEMTCEWVNTGIIRLKTNDGCEKIGSTGESELSINISKRPDKSISEVEMELLTQTL